MLAKRIFDLFFSSIGLLLLFPAFVVISVWIRLDSAGPVFFRQVRVGRFGSSFRIFKFRTMCLDAEGKGRQITVGEDPRITKSGKFLRKYKLDEFPQLINVFLGEMSLVGPRPEVPKYVFLYPLEVRNQVLSVFPGITDYASIEYKDENTVLGQSDDPERTYIEEVMPVKLTYCQRYVVERSFWIDIKLILKTIKVIIT